LPHIEDDHPWGTNRDVLIDYDNLNGTLNALQICKRVRNIASDALNNGQIMVRNTTDCHGNKVCHPI